MSKKIPDKWLYIPVVLLGLYFFIRLIDQSKLVHTFPFDMANDIPSYIASLFFLAKCGFHKFCPYWYNGFISFKTFFPGWQFFTYPIYKLSKNFLFSTYISIILMYILSFFFIFILGKNEKFSISKRIAFFLFFFTNAINVGNFFKLGRVPSLFGWCMFLGVSAFVFYYKNRRIDKKFVFLIPTLGFAILSHPQEAVLTSILIIPLFLIKKNFYERAIILLSVFFSIILTSFWWIPFVLNLSHGTMLKESHQGAWLWAIGGAYLSTSIAAFFVSSIFFIVFYYYWLSKNKSKKELLFFSPIILLNVLFFFRLTPTIPVLKNISPDPYIVFFLFFIIYLFFNINIKIFNKKIKSLIPYLLTFAVVLSIGISHFKTPYFVEHTFKEEEIISMFPYVNDKFLILNSHSLFSPPPKNLFHPYAYYSYTPIFFNLTTASGFYYFIAPYEYHKKYKELTDLVKEKELSCEMFKEKALFLNTTNFIAYEYMCENLESCGLEKIKEKNGICLYKLNTKSTNIVYTS